MSSIIKCKNCGSTDIEKDNARGDAVCTSCGTVLEDNLIVSEIQFEEICHGSVSIGQFVSSDATGGATNIGYGKFHVGSGAESREVTIKKAKTGISHLCHQLQLSNHYIETALNFFKMALMRSLTRGRKNTHIYAACVYITCRTEGTSHLLIDISDILQICCYELGRTYLKLSQALCINIPSVDPCLYVMRFANKLEFGDRTHEVSMTALRIVQRMKKDSIHSGRRPTGLCGAALLMASRMHEFNRTIIDLVKIVKIHESTLRKRLIEFADTPSSSLTLNEFMAVDLEAEQDPPAFKISRKKDRERIQKIGENELNELQMEIDKQLDKDLKKSMKRSRLIPSDVVEELHAENDVIASSTMEVINKCLAHDPEVIPSVPEEYSKGIKPDLVAMCLPDIINHSDKKDEEEDANGGEVDFRDLDDDEIDGYIMTEEEANSKNLMWLKLNAEYLAERKAKEAKLAKEKEEGKPEKKKRRTRTKRPIGPSNTAGEAIEKMLQEKKISSKINYDILKTLTAPKIELCTPISTGSLSNEKYEISSVDNEIIKQHVESVENDIKNAEVDQKFDKTAVTAAPTTVTPYKNLGSRKNKIPLAGLAIVSQDSEVDKESTVIENNDDGDEEEEMEMEPEPEPEVEHSSLKDMLNNGDDEDYYGYDDEHY